MKNKMLLLLSMIVVLLFVVSCAPKELTDEELEAELSKLTPEELEVVTAEDSGAFAGMAKANPRLLQLQRSYKQTVTAATAAPRTCFDSDADAQDPNGFDPFEKGSITWKVGSTIGGPVDDACASETLLRENYCSGKSGSTGVRLTKPVDCSQYDAKLGGTWKCVDGACVGEKKETTPAGTVTHQLPTCGDGNQQAPEECDDGNTINTDTCTNECKKPRCGDKIVTPPEECDDGNNADGDGCNADCRLEDKEQTPTAPVSGEKGFKYAYWECYNGEKQNQGGETSCKTSVTWQDYAEQFCLGKCNVDNSKCGVNSFSVTVECPYS